MNFKEMLDEKTRYAEAVLKKYLPAGYKKQARQ